MRIGVYGGSFNPPHYGHTTLATELIRLRMVDEVWLVVSPLNPLKQTSTDIMPDAERLRLCERAVEGLQGVRVCDVEMHMPRPSYMIDTLAELRRQHPEHEFVLVIGADNWLAFRRWKHHDAILSSYPIIVCPRPGYNVALPLPPNVTLAPTPLMPISSTQIRQQRKAQGG